MKDGDQYRDKVVLTLVILADHLKGPIVVAIAAGTEVRLAVHEVIGEGNALAWVEAEHVVLTARTSGLARASAIVRCEYA